jgi:hypothetical protein
MCRRHTSARKSLLHPLPAQTAQRPCATGWQQTSTCVPEGAQHPCKGNAGLAPHGIYCGSGTAFAHVSHMFYAPSKGAQRRSENGDKVLCLLELGVLPLFLWGGGVWRGIFITFYLLRQTPPPHPRAGVPVWCGLRWLSIRHQARPQGHAKSHSFP